MSPHGPAEKPAFTEDDVANDFVEAIDYAVVGRLGNFGRGELRRYEWAGDNDGTEWPFVVVRDSREFEVDIDVRVTELTPERKAKREADAKALLAYMEQLKSVQITMTTDEGAKP